MSAGQVIQRLQDLEIVVVKQLDRSLSKVQSGIALCWTTVTTIGQVVDTRVLGKVNKWNSSGQAWLKWSLVKAYDVAVDQQLSGAEISTDVVSNVQLGGVQVYVVVIMLCTGRALDCAASALCSWSMEAWRMFCHAYSLWNDARLVALMLEVLAILLDTKDAGVNLDAGCIKMTSIYLNTLDVDAFTKGSKGASKGSGEKQDSESVCWYCEKQQRASECRKMKRDRDM